MLVQEPVHAAIWHCLNHYAYGDATFLAERLFHEIQSDQALHLLATCYYRSGKFGQAYDVLQTNGYRTPQNKFLFAKCCTELNKYSEAESTLLGDQTIGLEKDSIQSSFGESASFVFQLLASVYAITERESKAKEADKAALELNPFLFKSFESLCDRGENPNPYNVFSTESLNNLNYSVGVNPVLNYANGKYGTVTTSASTTTALRSATSTPILPPPNAPTSQVQQNQNLVLLTPINQPYFSDTPQQWTNEPLSGINTLSLTSSEPEACTPLNPVSSMMATPSPCSMRPMPPPMNKPAKKKRPPHLFSNSGFVFGTLPSGCLKWNSQLSDSVLTPSPAGNNADSNKGSMYGGGSLVVLTPCNPNSAENSIQNTEQKAVKRSLVESNPLKSNVNLIGQTGNSQNITPSSGGGGATNNSGNGNNQNVRRSSRLFGSTQQSASSKGCKENSKTPPSSAGRSRKSKKFSKAELAEKNERNKQDKDLLTMEGEKQSSNPAITIQEPPCPPMSSDLLSEQAMVIQKSSIGGLMELLRLLGAAYSELAKYNSQRAISLLEEIPSHHRTSGWVLGLIGKAYFEMGDYKESKRYFKEMRDRDPHRLEMTEVYSTALWHLQEEVDLSALAQDLTRIDKQSPQAWCAAGNCFSHQKEHENAIKFFKRAVQVDPNFAYAYTLLGHEYVMIEELEKALQCFRSAVRVDRRHYNAWYGIGLTYYKQERYGMAEMYYSKALGINPQNPVLMCHLAVVQHALQKSDKALETLNTAICMAPKNPICKFERASILFASESYYEALRELKDLKELVPKESPVYFLMGKVHNKLGNTHMALMHFSWAMDLDPKGANSQIKDALDPALSRAANQDDQGTGDVEVGGVDVDDDTEEIEDMAAEEDPHPAATGVGQG